MKSEFGVFADNPKAREQERMEVIGTNNYFLFLKRVKLSKPKTISTDPPDEIMKRVKKFFRPNVRAGWETHQLHQSESDTQLAQRKG